MSRAFWTISIAAMSWGLAGCGTPKPIKFYSVQTPAAPANRTQTYPIDLVVTRLSGPAVLEAQPIVYKTGTNELSTYSYHHWTEAPTELVQEKLTRLLRNNGEFRSVNAVSSKTGGATKGDGLVLRGRLYEFSEVDGASIQGLVSMEFELYDRGTSRIVWTHFYSQSEPVPSKNVPAVVQAIDRNLDRGLNEVLVELRKYLTANPPGKS